MSRVAGTIGSVSKALGYVLLIFFVIVLCNYLSIALGSIIVSHPWYPIFASSDQLGSIDFSLFAKNGAGRSYITQGYGRTPYSYLYPDDWHDGIDIAAAYGAPIYSPNDGIVLAIGDQDDFCYHKAFGKYVAVKDPLNNLVLWYAHLGSFAVTPGETIKKGDEIGTVGNTGLETGTHLHFSIFEGNTFTMQARDGCGPEPTGQDIDPLNYLGTTYQ